MKNLKLLFPSLLLSLTMAISASAAMPTDANANMSLDSKQSSLSFVSVKKGTVAEAHSINKISGTLSDKGELKLSLDLSSVDTKIDIRNERMKKNLFEIDKFSTATITTTLSNLPEKDGISQMSAEATLELHGTSKPIKVEVTIMKSADTLMVASTKPIIINAADYGLEGGIAMLQKLAKLPSIATSVPVNFVLVFTNN